MFIKTTPIPVIDDATKPRDAQNILYLRADLTLGQHDALSAEERRLEKAHGDALTPAQQEILIFFHRLAGWEGPEFAGVEFNRQNVNRLDYDDPLVARAIVAAVNAHYKIPDDPEDADPKAVASAIQIMSGGSSAG
jgi:hypothetical protein